MSVQIHLVTESFTPEQRRDIAVHYAGLKRGEKSAYAASLGLRPHQIRRWISALADGDLDNERFPRKTGAMTTRDIAEIARLKKIIADMKAEHARVDAAKDARISKLEGEVTKLQDGVNKWEKASDALGKAITVLHKMNEPRGEAAEN